MTVTIVDFYADWCGPCKNQTPILEDLADEEEELELIKVDVDSEDPEYDPNRFQVRGLPTIVLLDEDEQVIQKFMGVTDAETIRNAY